MGQSWFMRLPIWTDVGTLRYYAKLRTASIWVALIALLGVLLMGILKGLIFAVGLTLIALMWKLSTVHDSVLGRLANSEAFVDVRHQPEAQQFPGLLIFRPNGILYSQMRTTFTTIYASWSSRRARLYKLF